MGLKFRHRVLSALRDAQENFSQLEGAMAPGLMTVFNVLDFGAKGDGTSDDTGAIQAAITACAAVAHGGTVFIPQGTYKITATLTVPVAQVNIVGSGSDATILSWATSVGAGTFAIDFQITGGDPTSELELRRHRTLRNLKLKGPGSGANVMDGLKWSTTLIVENVEIAGFRAGLYQFGNHQTIRDSYVFSNYYGFYIPAASPTLGDQAFYSTLVNNNAFSNIYIEADAVAIFQMFDVHLGFCQYDIYAAGGGSTSNCMADCWFKQCYSESTGRAIAVTNGRSIYRCRFDDHQLLWNDAYAGGVTANRAVFTLGGGIFGGGWFHKSTFDHFAFDVVGASIRPVSFIDAQNVSNNSFRQVNTLIDDIAAHDWSFATCALTPFDLSAYNNKIAWGDSEAIIAQTASLPAGAGAATAGDALCLYQFAGNGRINVRRATPTYKPMGMALHTAAGDGKGVLVQTKGDTLAPTIPVDGTVAAYDLLGPSATPGTLTDATGLADRSIYGMAQGVGGGRATVKLVGVWLPDDLLRTGDSSPPSGAAGGDLTGTYPNPTVGANKITQAKASVGTGATQLAGGDDARFPTTGQKNGLAGTAGTPGTGNEYATKQTTDLLAPLASPAFTGTPTGIKEASMATGTSGLATGAFSAYRHAAMNLAASAVVTIVPCDTEDFDVSSWFDTTTGKFTPQVAGYYRLTATIGAAAIAASKSLYMYLYKNGAAVKAGVGIQQGGAATLLVVSVAAVVQANGSTDYFEIAGQQTDTSARAVQVDAFAHFEGELVGRA